MTEEVNFDEYTALRRAAIRDMYSKYRIPISLVIALILLAIVGSIWMLLGDILNTYAKWYVGITLFVVIICSILVGLFVRADWNGKRIFLGLDILNK